MSDDIYKKIFGEVKKGTQYSTKGKFGSPYNSASLRSSMTKFRNLVYGGYAGQNLSKADADLIIGEIEPHLKRLPIGGKIPYYTKMSIRRKFWKYVLAGKLSQTDFEDAKKILEL
ncbi:MAG: hypothetical protein JW816_00790, partial [Candidatus Buchananbacteria bacterium]|nr:hypothetical protein [Candidatus Buchananbacteria bacterium]